MKVGEIWETRIAPYRERLREDFIGNELDELAETGGLKAVSHLAWIRKEETLKRIWGIARGIDEWKDEENEQREILGVIFDEYFEDKLHPYYYDDYEALLGWIEDIYGEGEEEIDADKKR